MAADELGSLVKTGAERGCGVDCTLWARGGEVVVRRWRVGSLAEEDPESKLDDRDGFVAWASIISSNVGAAVDTGESVNTDCG